MSLDHAILGFLEYKPMSGYDLKKVFDISINHFWHADQSQIYRTLARLADQELVTVEVIRQDDRPDRKVYRITKTGKDKLIDWLALPMPKNRPRIPGLVQMFFASHLSDDEILQKLEQRAEALNEWICVLESLPHVLSEYASEVESARHVYCWQLTLLAGVYDLYAQRDWLETAIADIKRGGLPRENDSYSPELLRNWPISSSGIQI